MLPYFLDKLYVIGKFLSSHLNRLRLRGARVEVIAYIVARSPKPSILLVQSVYGSTIMPPQEGVLLSEDCQSAFYRCLHEELGIDLPPNHRRLLHVRTIKYLGTLDLPQSRRGERLVADDADCTPFAAIKLTKKAYFAVIGIVRDVADLSLDPNGVEIVAADWYDFNEARQVVQDTNRPEKATVILQGLELCQRHASGFSEDTPSVFPG